MTSCGAGTPNPDGRPNLLLITVDTLRADHLGMYGYERPTSPNIDRWFGDSIVFQRAYSTDASTPTSIVSILTGQHPQNHGVRLFFQRIPDRTKTVSGHLRVAGYEAAAVVSNVVLTEEAIGLAVRFDHYDDYVDEPVTIRQVWERNARRTTDAALEWLESRNEKKPFFLWVHYIDPHGPYEPPPDKPITFKHDASQSVPVDRERMTYYDLDPKSADAYDYVDRYDEEIAYCDREIGRLLDRFGKSGLDSHTVMFFTADHGEGMIEHEWWFSHQYHVHEPIVRVPLAIRTPDKKSASVDYVTSLIDLAPTFLSVAGLPQSDEMDGRSLLDASGMRDPQSCEAFSEGSPYDALSQMRARITANEKWVVQVSRQTGTIQDKWRLRLDSDPGETQRLEWGNDDEGSARFLEMVARDPDPAGVPTEYAAGTGILAPKVNPNIGQDALEKLRALGYVR